MIGRVFGRWTVTGTSVPYVSPSGKTTGTRWQCTCQCGKIKNVRESSLLSGESTSCRCLAKELASARMKTHNMSSNRLYGIWYDMTRRCYDSRRKDYKHYGGRGIKVCDEWRNEAGLVQFIADMEHSFVEGLELDRKDVNGNYCPDNCKWSNRTEQCCNRRPKSVGNPNGNRMLTFNNKTMCVAEWARLLNIEPKVINDRINKLNWSVEKALIVPVGSIKPTGRRRDSVQQEEVTVQ